MEEFNSSSTLRRSFLFSLLVTAAIAVPALCLGAVPEAAPGQMASVLHPEPQKKTDIVATNGCEKKIEGADFRASFSWSNASGENVPMEIRVGKDVAQIFEKSSDGDAECVAVCRVKAPVLDRKVASIAPAALDMDCQSAGFNGLGSPAALVFSTQGQSVLRFGSWASGYRDATLAVGTDHLSTKLGS